MFHFQTGPMPQRQRKTIGIRLQIVQLIIEILRRGTPITSSKMNSFPHTNQLDWFDRIELNRVQMKLKLLITPKSIGCGVA